MEGETYLSLMNITLFCIAQTNAFKISLLFSVQLCYFSVNSKAERLLETSKALSTSKAYVLFTFSYFCYRRDGVVDRASASQSVDLGFTSLVESYQKTLKNGIHSFPAWRSAHKG